MQTLKGEAALKQVSHKVQVQLGVNHKEEILKASSKGQAPREEAHRLRNSEVKNNKVEVQNNKEAAEVKVTIPKVDAKPKVPR